MSDNGKRMRVSELCDALGAEVRGVDLARLDDAESSAIRDAFHEHLVLVFPDQDLTASAQAASPVPHFTNTRTAAQKPIT